MTPRRQIRPLLLTVEHEPSKPVNNFMRGFIVALCLFLVVTLMINIRVQVIEYQDDEGHRVTRWVYPPPEPFVLPQAKPTMPVDPGISVQAHEPQERKRYMTVWRVLRFLFQIYN